MAEATVSPGAYGELLAAADPGASSSSSSSPSAGGGGGWLEAADEAVATGGERAARRRRWLEEGAAAAARRRPPEWQGAVERQRAARVVALETSAAAKVVAARGPGGRPGQVARLRGWQVRLTVAGLILVVVVGVAEGDPAGQGVTLFGQQSRRRLGACRTHTHDYLPRKSLGLAFAVVSAGRPEEVLARASAMRRGYDIQTGLNCGGNDEYE